MAKLGQHGLKWAHVPNLGDADLAEFLKGSIVILYDENQITPIIYLYDGFKIEYHVIKNWDTVPTKGTTRCKNIARLLQISPEQLQRVIGKTFDNGINVIEGDKTIWYSQEPIMFQHSYGRAMINAFRPTRLEYDYRWKVQPDLIKEFTPQEKDILDRILSYIDSMTRGRFDRAMETLIWKMGNLFKLPAHSIDLYGLQGCGKSALAYMARDAIAGPKEYVANLTDLTEKFTAYNNDPAMVVCDEASTILDRGASARWDLMRKNPERTRNQKYIPIADAINMSGYIVTANPGHERRIAPRDRVDMLIDCYESNESRSFIDFLTKNKLWEDRGRVGAQVRDVFRRHLQFSYLSRNWGTDPYWADSWDGQYTWTDISTPRAIGRYSSVDGRGVRGVLNDTDGDHRQIIQNTIDHLSEGSKGYFPIISGLLEIKPSSISNIIEDANPGKRISSRAIAPVLKMIMADRGIQRVNQTGNTRYRIPYTNVLEDLSRLLQDMIDLIDENNSEGE